MTPAFWANPFSAGQPRRSRARLTPPSAEAWEIGEVVRLVSGPGSGPTRAGRHWWGGLNPEGGVQTGHPRVLSFRPLGVRRVQAWSWGNNFQLWLNRLAAPRTRSCAQPPPAGLSNVGRAASKIGEHHRACAFDVGGVRVGWKSQFGLTLQKDLTH